MLNLELIKTRLSHYGAAWLLAFLVCAMALIGGPWLLGLDVIDMSEQVLPVAFTVIALGLILFLIMTLASRETPGTKLVLLVLTLFLTLPLLWSPVLAAVAGAWVAERSIEYSTAYARFRIVVGNLIYPLAQMVFSRALFETVWWWMEFLSAFIGFLAALERGWSSIKSLFGLERAPAAQETQGESEPSA